MQNTSKRFGSDERGEWQGYQAWRPLLDEILLHRVRACGATVHLGCRVRDVVQHDNGTLSLVTDTGDFSGAWTLDATGRSRVLSRRLNVDFDSCSRPLVAQYGYVTITELQQDFSIPLIRRDSSGWEWIAQVRADQCAWVSVQTDDRKRQPPVFPKELSHCRPIGRIRGADVTWQLATTLARPGWFLLGDAAAVLDPTSSHGVLARGDVGNLRGWFDQRLPQGATG